MSFELEHDSAEQRDQNAPCDQGGGYPHAHVNNKAVVNRMARIIGHMESIKRMVESGRDCSEVLIQVAAVRSALNNVGKIILQEHIKHCITDAMVDNDQQAIEDLCDAVNKFMK